FGVLPWSAADPIASVDGTRAEIGPPRSLTRAGRFGKRLTMRIGSLEATEIGAVARANAGDEKTHAGILGDRARRPDRQKSDTDTDPPQLEHALSSSSPPRCGRHRIASALPLHGQITLKPLVGSNVSRSGAPIVTPWQGRV